MNKHLARVLYKVGLRATLPAETINSVKIKDNAEELIDIKQNKNLFFSDKLQNREKVFLRKTVYEKLCEAQKYLPLNYYFKIYSAYRPIEEQQKLWNAKYLKFQKEHPDLSAEELTNLVKRVCSDPRFGFGSHQTGGAVDIALCNDKGIDYSMGTKHSEVNEKTKTNSKFITNAINNLLEKVNLLLQRERRFISDAAHELRTPLTALKIQLDVAKLSADDEPARESALNKLEQGINRATRLVEQLLALSR